MIYGAILAGGIGKRVENYSIPKQFISIGGVPIIVITLRQFLKNERIEKIYVAIHPDWMIYAEKLFTDSFSEEELLRIRIISGGKERIDSFANIMLDIVKKTGLNDEDILICHDSVRPFVRQEMIDECIAATLKQGLALTVVPTTDTIHISKDMKSITGTLDREGLFNGQTPSGFNLKLLNEALNKFTDAEKSKVTGTTQLMLQLGHEIAIVKGHTSNFKITTDMDIEVAERMVRSKDKKRKISLLDCTLRDGGIVIDFNFGNRKMEQIKTCLEDSGVEFIECGYLDSCSGSDKERTCFDSEQSIKNTLLSTGKKAGVTYVAMIDYGKYDVTQLNTVDENGIDGIRLAFHKENWKEAVEWGKIILNKGYQLYIQPMVTMRYTDEEFRELILCCNKELSDAKAFYIVDSFGQMDNMTLLHKLEIADQYVHPKMKIGLHAHNNRQMAFSNACTLVNFISSHDMMLDSSILGMGKGAGNLCTELIIPVLIAEGNEYSAIGIYDEITNYFSPMLKSNPWGYSLDYYLSSLYGCTPSYIKIFTSNENVTTDILVELLKNMPEEKKAACDKEFAAQYLKDYFA